MEFTGGQTIIFSTVRPCKIFRKINRNEIKELKNDENVLKVLAESTYWKRFCPIEILAIFSKPVIQMEEDMSPAQHFLDYH